MKAKYLISWFVSKLWYEKFFLLLILIRPIVEPFYYLKSSSALLSPLYWIGILTFLICLLGITTSVKYKSRLDKIFGIWAAFVILNILCLYFIDSFFDFVSLGMRLINPVLIFYFLRGFIKSKIDLYGILTLFLLASVIASFWLMLDLSRSGFNLRDKSSFADVVNYGLYVNIALIIVFYFYYKAQQTLKFMWKPKIYGIAIFCLYALITHFAIKHLASIAVTLLIVALYVFYISRRKAGAFLIAFAIISALVLAIGEQFYDQVIDDRIRREVEIVEGHRDQSQALHGRVTRWEWLFKDYEKVNLSAQLIGYPTSMKPSEHMIAITPHNDFIRILFFTGVFGLFFYLRFLYHCFKRLLALPTAEKMLSMAALSAMILYSLSTVPTFYQGFNNFIFLIFAFLALPLKNIHEQD